jgi:hypothetical protein
MSKQATKDSARSAASQPTYLLPVETIIPIPPPLLPPTNSMRSSITPAVYLSIYDKVVANALTPSCPINLSDMIRSCVAGWKRDGEWPPKSAPLDASNIIAVRRRRKATDASQGSTLGRRMSLGFLGRAEKADEGSAGKGIRKSLQRVLGLGHAHGHPDDTVASPTTATPSAGAGKDLPL